MDSVKCADIDKVSIFFKTKEFAQNVVFPILCEISVKFIHRSFSIKQNICLFQALVISENKHAIQVVTFA